MSLDGTALIGYLIAGYEASSKWRIASFVLGFVVTLPAMASVVTNDASTLYYLACLNAALLVLWWVANNRYFQKQSAAHTARRAALIVNGLGEDLSAGEKRRLIDKFSVDADRAKNSQKADYYATQAEPGPLRLLECLEESAFYSSKLHKLSANAWVWLVAFYAVLFLAIALFFVPSANNDILMTMVRVFFAATVFVLSADVLGSLISHRRCANETSEILSRIEIAKKAGKDSVNTADALLILEDYTSAIQSAPEVVPFVYGAQVSKLNAQWAAYLKG